MVVRALAVFGLLQAVGFTCTGDGPCVQEEDFTSFMQRTVQVHKATTKKHKRSTPPPDVARAVVRTVLRLKERLPPVMQHQSAIVLLSVGKYSRRLCEDGHGMFMVLLMSTVCVIGAIIGVMTYRSKYGNEMSQEEYDGHFKADHVHWKSPVASLGGRPHKPPPLMPRLQIPHPSSPYQVYSPYESTQGSLAATPAVVHSRPSSGLVMQSLVPAGSGLAIPASSGSQLPVGPEASIRIPRGVQHHDIGTARGLSPYSSPVKFTEKYHDSFVSLSSGSQLPSQARISLESPRQSTFAQISKAEADRAGGTQGPPPSEPDKGNSKGIAKRPTPDSELEALLDERRRISDSGYGERPPTRTPREIVRDVNLRRSEAEEEMMSRIHRM